MVEQLIYLAMAHACTVDISWSTLSQFVLCLREAASNGELLLKIITQHWRPICVTLRASFVLLTEIAQMRTSWAHARRFMVSSGVRRSRTIKKPSF